MSVLCKENVQIIVVGLCVETEIIFTPVSEGRLFLCPSPKQQQTREGKTDRRSANPRTQVVPAAPSLYWTTKKAGFGLLHQGRDCLVTW